MNWTDIAVLIIIGISVIQGWRKGFIMAVVNFLKWFVGFAVAYVFYKTVTGYILENLWNPLPEISDKIQNFLYEALNISADQSVTITSTEMSSLIQSLNLPTVYEDNLTALIPDMSSTTTAFVTSIADSLSRILFDAVGFIIILLVTVMVFTLLGLIMNSIAKLPVLNELNRGGGVLVGGVIGLATVYFIMAMLTFLYPVPFVQDVVSNVESSRVAIYFYKYNILTFLIKSFFETGLFIFTS